MRGTIGNLYDLYTWDNTLFDGLEVPDGVDKTVLIHTIFRRSMDQETLYSDPVFMKSEIAAYSKQRIAAWTRMYEALQDGYNPLYNFDRFENTTLDRRTDTTEYGRKDSGQDKTTYGSQTTVRDTGKTTPSGTDTAEAYTGAFDSADLVNTSRTTQTAGIVTNTDSTTTTTPTGSDTIDKTNQSSGQDKVTSDYVHEAHLYGNIGVTTSQQMLESELDLRKKYDIYTIISEDIINEFCLFTVSV